MSLRPLSILLSSIVIVSVALAGCSSTQSTQGTVKPPASSSTGMAAHNAADVSFSQDMILHHQGAVEMANLALERQTSDDVNSFATDIVAAQELEIQKMSLWLKTWDEKVPTSSMSGGMSGMKNVPGMMSDTQMKELDKASGSSFDQKWLQEMIGHHQGAILMAQDEVDQGSNSQVKELARQIIKDQKVEISNMKSVLSTTE